MRNLKTSKARTADSKSAAAIPTQLVLTKAAEALFSQLSTCATMMSLWRQVLWLVWTLTVTVAFLCTHPDGAWAEEQQHQGMKGMKPYRPVVILHGIMDKRGSMQLMADFIQEAHPGTNVTIIDVLHGWRSLAPLWYQVQEFGAACRAIMASSPDGINMIGYSQGGMVARGIVQSMDDHNIRNFVSLSSPQAGQYGDKFLHLFFPNYVKSTVYKVFYTDLGQYTAVANYWNDPHEQRLYKKYSQFLVEINNERETPASPDYKRNFLRLNRMIAIGGPDDGVITPWQSSMFGYFDNNETLVNMEDRDLYIRDVFGLRTLNEDGRFTRIQVPGVYHLNWHNNVTVLRNYVIPWLD